MSIVEHQHALSRFGTSTDYVEAGSDGLTLAGAATMWDDFMVPLQQGRRGSNDKPDFDFAEVGYLFPQNDATEVLYFNTQLPHCWKEGSDVYPHLHWHQTAATAVGWKIDYRWTNIGAAPAGAWTTLALDTSVAAYTSGTLHQISKSAAPITGSGKTLSSMLQIKLYRQDNTTSGDVLATSFDLHLELDALGSRTEYAK